MKKHLICIHSQTEALTCILQGAAGGGWILNNFSLKQRVYLKKESTTGERTNNESRFVIDSSIWCIPYIWLCLKNHYINGFIHFFVFWFHVWVTSPTICSNSMRSSTETNRPHRVKCLNFTVQNDVFTRFEKKREKNVFNSFAEGSFCSPSVWCRVHMNFIWNITFMP